MNKNTKGILTVLGVVVVAGIAISVLTKNKRAFATVIMKGGAASNYATLLTFDEDYLRAWAKAVKRNQTSFEYKNETYLTQGGKKQ